MKKLLIAAALTLGALTTFSASADITAMPGGGMAYSYSGVGKKQMSTDELQLMKYKSEMAAEDIATRQCVVLAYTTYANAKIDLRLGFVTNEALYEQLKEFTDLRTIEDQIPECIQFKKAKILKEMNSQ